MKLDKLWSKKDMRYSRTLKADLITADDLPLTPDDSMMFKAIPDVDAKQQSNLLKAKVFELPIRVKTIMGKDQMKRRVISTPANFKIPDLPKLEIPSDFPHLTEPPSIKVPEISKFSIQEPPPVITKSENETEISRNHDQSIMHKNVQLSSSSLRHVSLPQSTSFATYSSNRINQNQRQTTLQKKYDDFSDFNPYSSDFNPYSSDYSNIIQIYLDSHTNYKPPIQPQTVPSSVPPPPPLKNSPNHENLQKIEEQLGFIQESIEAELSSPELVSSESSDDDVSTIYSDGKSLSRFITANETHSVTMSLARNIMNKRPITLVQE